MAKDTDAGIDYSLGRANVDRHNGIHYGVISQNEVLQAWADASEPYYGEPELDDDGNEMDLDDFAEPVSFTYKADGYSCEAGEDGDIFILKSPYYTRCAFCSPCAPGAGYTMDTREGGVKTYCLGHDWFDGGKAPYPVFNVKTDERVKADDTPDMSCDQCSALMINGVYCHETGCPNARKTKVNGEWVTTEDEGDDE